MMNIALNKNEAWNEYKDAAQKNAAISLEWFQNGGLRNVFDSL